MLDDKQFSKKPSFHSMSWTITKTIRSSTCLSPSGLLQPSCASKLLATVAFSVGAVLCAPAEAQDASQRLAAAQAACTKEVQVKTKAMRELIAEAQAEGDKAEVAKLQGKLASREKNLTEACIGSAKADDRIAKADDRIAKAVAQNAKLDSEIADISEAIALADKTNAATRQKIAFLKSFTGTDPVSIKKYNEMIANIPKDTEETLALVARASKYVTDKHVIASLEETKKITLEIAKEYKNKAPLDAKR